MLFIYLLSRNFLLIMYQYKMNVICLLSLSLLVFIQGCMSLCNILKFTLCLFSIINEYESVNSSFQLLINLNLQYIE